MGRIVKQKNNDEGGFPEKYAKLIRESGTMEEMDGADEATLKKIIVDSETSIEEQEQLKDTNEHLLAAKNVIKDVGGGFREAIKYQNAKIKYALYCLEKMGKI